MLFLVYHQDLRQYRYTRFRVKILLIIIKNALRNKAFCQFCYGLNHIPLAYFVNAKEILLCVASVTDIASLVGSLG